MEKQQRPALAAMVVFLIMHVFFFWSEKASGATPEEMQQWLQAHNEYRALHGAPPVTWSTSLEASAQAWADTCPDGHSSSGYGENMAYASYSLTPQNVVGLWYSEEAFYDYSNPGWSWQTGHFTQVVWKSTTQIGCGCETGCTNGWAAVCVCQYSPPGNFLGQFAENVLPPTSAPVPGTPTLSSPANGATVSAASITFSWSSPTGNPTKYHLQVGTSSAFSSLFYSSESVTGDSVALSGFPNDGSTFYWRLRAYNASGWGSWSSGYHFINGSTARPDNSLTAITPADLNGDSHHDLAGVTADGQIFYTLDLQNWIWLPGTLAQLTAGDLNGDGRADLAGVTVNGQIFYTLDLQSWNWLPGILAQLTAGDLNGDGQADLAGVTSSGEIYYSLDLISWQHVPGLLKTLSAGDLNDDGRDDLIGVTSAGQIFYSTDLSSWEWMPGKLKQITAGKIGDFSGAVGVADDGSISCTYDRYNWTTMAGPNR